MEQPALQTPRLILEPLTNSDAEFVRALMNSEGWLRFIGDRGIHTDEAATRYIEEGPRASYAKNGFGLMLVRRRDTRERVGLCGLLKRDALPDVEVGFAFLGAHSGQGFASESAHAALRYGACSLGLTRIAAIVKPDNAASLRVLAKLGFSVERTVQLQPEAPLLHLLARSLSPTEFQSNA